MRCGSSRSSEAAARFFAPGSAQRSLQVGDFDAFHFGIEIHPFLRNQDGFLAGSRCAAGGFAAGARP